MQRASKVRRAFCQRRIRTAGRGGIAPRVAALVALGTAAGLLVGCGAQRPPQDPRPAWQPQELAPPAPDRAWQPPEAADSYRAPRDAWRAGDAARALPEAGTTYDLPALVDVALRDNPTTRAAWETARAAAARYGQSLAPYYPTLSANGFASPNQRVMEPDTGPAALTLRWDKYEGAVRLTYTLLDFGRRAQSAETARQRLLAANFGFNRVMQDVVFSVQLAYYNLDAAQGLRTAAEQNLALARTVLTAADARLDVGLATRPEQLLAKQVEARAVYDLENAKVAVQDAQAGLALALGVPANQSPAIESLFDQPLPPDLEREVDVFIDDAVKDRPDLAARLAELRAAEAAIGRAKAEFFPSVGFRGAYGVQSWDYTVNNGAHVQNTQPAYSTVFTFDWTLFNGFDRLNALRAAESDAAAARAGLATAQLDIIAQVWRAYYEYRAAVRKLAFADALLAAAQDAYDANHKTYEHGLTNIVDLLTAERDLANARYTLVLSRAELLITAARVAYAAGAVKR
ncbi:MAG: TolC family protein [bacterium]